MKSKSTLITSLSLLLAVALFAGACGGTETAENANATDNANAESAAPSAPADETADSANTENANSDDSAAQDGKIQRISFKPGATSGSAKGTVKGYDRNDYVFNAKKGQKIKVNLKTSSTFAYFNISDKADGFALEMDPRPLDVTSWEAVAPKDGDYFVRVYLVRAEARRDGKADYTLEVSITGAGGSKTAAAAKPNWFNCPDLIEIAVTFRETGGNRIAEIEIGDTVLRLPATDPVAAQFGDGKNSFSLVGDTATLKYRGKTHTCERMAAPF